MLAGSAVCDLAAELVLDIYTDAQLLAVVWLTVFFGVDRVKILLPAFGGAPLDRNRILR